MAGETVYRLLADEGIAIVENSGTKTVTLSVPGLATKLNIGDIVQATQLQAGIAEIATNAEVQAGTDPDRIVTPAGLAAASQASLTDATAARLMRVGGFGLGGACIALNGTNLNTEMPTGFYYCTGGINSPISTAAAGDGWLTHRDNAVSGYASQIYEAVASNRMFVRKQQASTWSSWTEVYHTGNFDPASKANTSGNYPGLVVGNSAQVGSQTAEMLAPPGMVSFFARPSLPSGWLEANGAAISRSTYAALFAAIGVTYGAGNGSSTFTLPDLRGMFLRAYDAGRGVDPGRPFASSQSSANLSHGHAGATDSAGSHAHGGSTDVAGDHNHQEGSTAVGNAFGGGTFNGNQAYNNGAFAAWRNPLTSTDGGHAHNIGTDTQGAHAHNVSVNASGGAESRPINMALYAFIKF